MSRQLRLFLEGVVLAAYWHQRKVFAVELDVARSDWYFATKRAGWVERL